jgi:transposase-like protein
MPEQHTERAYWGKDVAKQLGIGRSTLTKWCLALESQGYPFVRGENNSRAFTEQDIFVLQHMKELVQVRSLTLNTAVNVVLSRVDLDKRTGGVHEENSLLQTENSHALQPQEQFGEQGNKGMALLFQHMEAMVAEFTVMKQELQDIKAQNEYLKEAIRNQEKQQAQIEYDRSSKENRRDEQLMSLIRDMQETKKLIAAAEQKQGWFSKLFSTKK